MTFQIDKKMTQQYKFFPFLSMLYCTLLIASVLLPYKLIDLFGFAEPGGIFIFPLTYLLVGVIAEGYGRTMALRMIYSSLFCLFIFNVIIAVIIRVPSIKTAPHQEVFMQAFNHSIRLFIGCFIGLICSDLTNVYKITKLKVLLHGKYFAQRCLWATAISEAIFNIITYSITYIGMIPVIDIFNLVLDSWILKMLYSLLMIFPLLLLMNFIKKSEGINTNIDSVSEYHSETLLRKFSNI